MHLLVSRRHNQAAPELLGGPVTASLASDHSDGTTREEGMSVERGAGIIPDSRSALHDSSRYSGREEENGIHSAIRNPGVR